MIEVRVDTRRALEALALMARWFDGVVQSGVDAALEEGEAVAKAKGGERTAASIKRTPDAITAHAPWAAALEYGRGPVTAKNGKALRFEVGGRVLFRRSVGPAKPRPFMRPARDVIDKSKAIEKSVDRFFRSVQ